MASPSLSEKSFELSGPKSPSPQPVSEGDASNDLSTVFAASLEAKDEAACTKLLDENLESLTRSGDPFEWLKDAAAIGLNSTEIVNLLLEESTQSPWICYEMVAPTISGIDHMFHSPEFMQQFALPTSPGNSVPKVTEAGVKRRISELCGLGGVIPTPHDRALWMTNVKVASHRRHATISYGSPTRSADDGASVVSNQCLSALSRLIRLFEWLQVRRLIDEFFVIFRINSEGQVEAVKVPLSLIGSLTQRLADTTVESIDTGDRIRRLRIAALDILELVYLSRDTPPVATALDDCALAVQVLCIAMLSFGQEHIGSINPFFLEHSLSHIILEGALEPSTNASAESGTTTSHRKLHFQLASLTCAGDMIDSRVMVFADRVIDPDEQFDLSIAPEDLLNLWGPGTLVPYPSLEPKTYPATEWLRIEIRRGIVYRPSTDTSKMHWKAGVADDLRDGIAFELKVGTRMTIGAILNERHCPIEPGPDNTVSRKNINNTIEELGTWPERWNLRELQAGFQGGQFLNATFNATWIKADSRTRKQRVVERVDLDFLDQRWGLLVSLCTGVAQRVPLREVIAEVLPPMMDARMERTPEWQALLSIGIIEELKKPTFRDWYKKLEMDVQSALTHSIGHVLHNICWTGVNNASKLVVACPQYGNSGACIHVPRKDARAVTWLFKDTERSATFACLTNTCFSGDNRAGKCQNTRHPRWKNQVPALITSVCQYQWLGADDWTKLPQNDLQNNGVYWMGTSVDKRRVTIETHQRDPARLSVSNSSAHWRFFRRARERVERIREAPLIELRERSLMTEEHAQDVVIVHK